MKWVKGATEGVVVAGGQGKGNALTQLSGPRGVLVDAMGTVYVADWGNHRVTTLVQGSERRHCPCGWKWLGRQSESVELSHWFVLRSSWSSLCRRLPECSSTTFLSRTE